MRAQVDAHNAVWAQWYLLGLRDPDGTFTALAEGRGLLSQVGVQLPPWPKPEASAHQDG